MTQLTSTDDRPPSRFSGFTRTQQPMIVPQTPFALGDDKKPPLWTNEEIPVVIFYVDSTRQNRVLNIELSSLAEIGPLLAICPSTED